MSTMRIAGMIVVGLVSGVIVSPAAMAAGTLDQQFAQLPVASSAPITPSLYYGTAVTPHITGQLSQVDIYVDRHLSAATQDLTMTIYATSAGLPTGSPLAVTSIPATDVAGNYDWVTFNFSNPAQVNAGSQFAIVLTTLDSHSNAYLWAGTDGITASPYIGGYAAYNQGAGWVPIASYSQMFRTYVLPSSSNGSTPPPVIQQFELAPSESRASAACDAAAANSLNWGGSGAGGWGSSWAQWANAGNGGSVCTRTLVYSNDLGHWTHA